MQQRLGLTFTPDVWQSHVVQRILKGYDIMVVAATGLEKWLIFEGTASLAGRGKGWWCCGIDLSTEHLEVGHKHVHHRTHSAADDNLERCHMRALMLVGTPLNELKVDKAFATSYIESAIIRASSFN
ncbi:hypothetical protein GGX14DRAFT_565164 [Mycena pura]|uniref:Uncharacterized protein n=1 Tax=Mycena pura TaxID=153505 RepID=A0AAD6YB61_9AGAR|nr:hypothetical protein GGX14DRAFT_565164 [Mycena pura]